MQTFISGFTGFFSAKNLGAAVAFVLFLALLVWAGMGPDDLAAEIPVKRPW